MSIIVLLKLYY